MESASSLQYNFFEEVYDTLDWTKEPTQTWEELCYKKCVLLRQKYKKLSLFYSAGRDSHHVLRCFIAAGIQLDELILLDNVLLPKRRGELHDDIMPQALKYIQQYPSTKLTTITLDNDDFDAYFTDDWYEKDMSTWLHGMYTVTNFNYMLRNKLNATAEPDTGFILGVDKPRIVIEDGKYYSVVVDKTMEHYHIGLPNCELFYYGPDIPELHLKQTWMTLNYLEKMHGDTAITNEVLVDFCGNSFSEWYDDFCISCGRGPAFDLSLDIQNGHATRRSGRVPELLHKLETDIATNRASGVNFSNAVTYLGNNYPSAFNGNDPVNGTVGVYSKRYYLKDV